MFVELRLTVSLRVCVHPQTQKLMRGSLPKDRFASDEFGTSICLSGRLLAVGIPGEDTVATDAGAVGVFIRDAGTGEYTQLHEFHYDLSQANDRCALSVWVYTLLLSEPGA